MDALFIYPPWTVFQSRGFLMNCLPPLGLLSVAAYVRSKGHSVAVADVFAERLSPSELRATIRKFRPRHVGMTVLSPMETSALAIARTVKEEVPDCVVVMGGVHAEVLPEPMLRSGNVDLIVRGDGERPMAAIVAGMPRDEIESVTYLDASGNMRHNRPQKPEMNLDLYPAPAYDLVDLSLYRPSATSYENLPAVNVMMTRGCPGTCTFCNSAHTVFRSHSVERVVETVQMLKARHGIKQIQFFDDTLTLNKSKTVELCRMLEEVGITFSCYVRGDTFDDELARALRDAGCHHIMMGIEAGSERIMRGISKSIPKERYAEMVRIAHSHGIEVRGGFIIGHIGETWETMEESLRFAMDLDLDFLQISVNTPYPGTQLFRQAAAEGRIEHLDLRRYGQGEPIVRLDGLTLEQISAFEQHAWRTFYARPAMFWRQLRRVKNRNHLEDLYNAFKVLILNRLVKGDDTLSEWEVEIAPEVAYAARHASMLLEDCERASTLPLTHEARGGKARRRRVG